ncbi:MAG: hypothetical protein HYS38_08875 [Acidobacteria bacterium]|nr:hypothetical protein [Acidobacteriota bacterium]
MCTATAGWFNPEGKLTAEQVANQIVEFVWHGLIRSTPRRQSADLSPTHTCSDV